MNWASKTVSKTGHVEFEGSAIDYSHIIRPAMVPPGMTNTSGHRQIFVKNNLVATVGKSYHLLPNRVIYDKLRSMLDRMGLNLEVVGQIKDGVLCFLQSEMHEHTVGQDIVNVRMTTTTAHDGTQGVGIGLSTVTIVCQNTFMAAYKQLSKVRHTASMLDSIDRIMVDIEKSFVEERNFIQAANEMANTPVSVSAFELPVILATGVDITQTGWAEALSTKKFNKVTQAIETAKWSAKTHGLNRWGLHSTITNITTHHQGTEKTRSEKFVVDSPLDQRSWKLFGAEKLPTITSLMKGVTAN